MLRQSTPSRLTVSRRLARSIPAARCTFERVDKAAEAHLARASPASHAHLLFAAELRLARLPARACAATAYHGRVFACGSRSGGSHTIMISSIRSSLLRRVAFVAVVFGGLAACQKNDASAGQVAGKLNDAAQAAGQKLDQAASYVGQQVDATKTPREQNLESALGAVDQRSIPVRSRRPRKPICRARPARPRRRLGKAASLTGQGLETAGRKLQEWSAQSSASSANASASSSGSSDSQRCTKADGQVICEPRRGASAGGHVV